MVRAATMPIVCLALLGCSATRVIDGNSRADDNDNRGGLGGPRRSDEPVTFGGPSSDGSDAGQQEDGQQEDAFGSGADGGPRVVGDFGHVAILRESADADADLWLPETGDFVFRDAETGSLWNLRGQAFDGELTGAQIGQIAAYTVFWFSWSASHDGGEIWGHNEPNETAPIERDAAGDCTVPCDEIRSGGPPPDGIPALDHAGRWGRPRAATMLEAGDADYLNDESIVAGVLVDGQARAYAHSVLNWHENHIDRIGDTEFNVTYCPLTGSAIVFPADQGGDQPMYLYVSGRLFNDNLTMFERDAEEPTFWNQVLQKGIAGPRAGDGLSVWPVTETTWGRWKQMHPDTLVESDDTGYVRDYGRNPYTTSQLSTAGTLQPVTPRWQSTYDNKDRVLAIDGPRTSRAYAYPAMDREGARVVINDTLDKMPILVVYEARSRMAVPFSRLLDGRLLTFEGTTSP